MSVNVYDPVNDRLIPVAGATLYADTPIGAIQAFDAEEVPDGWLIFNGQTVLRSDYPDLWARANRNGQVGEGKFYGIGDGSTTFTLADLRETSLKGYGETSRSVGAHVKSGGLGIGEFIDDRIQNHRHELRKNGGDSGVFGTCISSNTPYNQAIDNQVVLNPIEARTGLTTEVKAVGVVWAVKAKQVGLPIDLKQQVEEMMSDTTGLSDGYFEFPNGMIFQWGETAALTPTSQATISNYYAVTEVTFKKQFKSAPIVIADPKSNAGFWNASAYSITTTGFTVSISGDRNDSGVPVQWIAIGV